MQEINNKWIAHSVFFLFEMIAIAQIYLGLVVITEIEKTYGFIMCLVIIAVGIILMVVNTNYYSLIMENLYDNEARIPNLYEYKVRK